MPREDTLRLSNGRKNRLSRSCGKQSWKRAVPSAVAYMSLRHGFGIDQATDFADKILNALCTLIAMLPVAHGYLPAGLFAIAHHQHVRNLLQLGLADL